MKSRLHKIYIWNFRASRARTFIHTRIEDK